MTIVANTKLFNVRNSLTFYSPLRNISNSQFYVFTARHTPASSAYPVAITDSVKETEYDLYEKLIFGKQINPEDVVPMIDRYDWVSGTVYAMYDDQDPLLYTKNFFVVSQESGNYHVFKCLYNVKGIASTAQPLFSQTSADDESYTTADGYRWKYMYTISSADYAKFTTALYVPVTPNTSVTSFASNGSIDSIIVDQQGSSYYSFGNGAFTSISVGGNTLLHAINTGSSNNNFYTGSAIYIASGSGAGQVKEITSYTISGNQYLVGVASAFNPQPDLTSAFTIAPNVKILGDGSGASAIAVVNTTSKAISRVDMIKSGNNYSYANVSIIGNTGLISANSAVVRAVISPRGGHGSNVVAELNANKVGISVTFSNSESGNISVHNDYSTIGVIQAPLFANTEITFNTATGSPQAGETVVQYIGSNTAAGLFKTSIQNYTYNTGNYSTLNLTGATTLAVNDSIYQTTPAAAASGVVINLSGNTIVIRRDSGSFSPTSTILKLGTPTVNNVINTVSAGFSNTIYGVDSVSNALFSFSTNNSIDVWLNGIKLFNGGVLPSTTNAIAYSMNSTSISLKNKTFSNTDIVTITKYISTATLSNTQYSAAGIVQSANSTVVKLTNTSGKFIANAMIYGSNSGFYANAVSIAGASSIFNQTLKITATYNAGSQIFALDDYCQQDTPGVDGAFGYIQDIESLGGNSYNFYVTGVKGVFESGASKYIQSADGSKIATVSALKQPDLIRYTGNILYSENIIPVSRANNQSETVKLVIKYY